MADRRIRVLVVHLDEPMTEIVARMLGTAGYECHAAWQEPDISRLRDSKAKFDVLFFHVTALEKDQELLRWTLSGAGREIPLVLTAARNRSQISADLLERGAFLKVPFECEEVLAIVHAAVAEGPRRSS